MVCGRCGKPQGWTWTKCEHCKATFAEFPPIPSAKGWVEPERPAWIQFAARNQRSQVARIGAGLLVAMGVFLVGFAVFVSAGATTPTAQMASGFVLVGFALMATPLITVGLVCLTRPALATYTLGAVTGGIYVLYYGLQLLSAARDAEVSFLGIGLIAGFLLATALLAATVVRLMVDRLRQRGRAA